MLRVKCQIDALVRFLLALPVIFCQLASPRYKFGGRSLTAAIILKPQTDDDWRAKRDEVYGAFSPGAPIKLQEDLSGREEQASRLRSIMLGAGEHALIYGERGVGKTSISNTFYASINGPTRRVKAIHVNCGTSNFPTIWRKVFRRISATPESGARSLDQLYENDITPDDVEVEFMAFEKNELPIIVLDEFDKVADDATKLLTTDLIKSLSDHGSHAKIVLVGIRCAARRWARRTRSRSRRSTT